MCSDIPSIYFSFQIYYVFVSLDMSSNKYSISHKTNELYEIAPGFWNVRSHLKVFVKLADIGTHMSIVRLSNANFVVFDTVELNDHLISQINRLTDNGDLIEGVIGTHPFHTRSFLAFYQAYPQAAYYGTPRHLRRVPQIPWLGSLDNCNVRQKWEPDVEMRIPAGEQKETSTLSWGIFQHSKKFKLFQIF
jgi:hypothetical protein